MAGTSNIVYECVHVEKYAKLEWIKMNTSFVRMTSFSLHYIFRFEFLVIAFNFYAFYYSPRICSCGARNFEINHNDCGEKERKNKRMNQNKTSSCDSQMSFCGATVKTLTSKLAKLCNNQVKTCRFHFKLYVNMSCNAITDLAHHIKAKAPISLSSPGNNVVCHRHTII